MLFHVRNFSTPFEIQLSDCDDMDEVLTSLSKLALEHKLSWRNLRDAVKNGELTVDYIIEAVVDYGIRQVCHSLIVTGDRI